MAECILRTAALAALFGAAWACGGCGAWEAVKRAEAEEQAERERLAEEKAALRDQWVADELAKRRAAIREERAREDAQRERREGDERARLEKAMREAAETDRKIERLRAEAARREDELRSFALKESPRIWPTLQRLRAEVEVQDERIAEMQRSAREGGLSFRGTEEYERVYRARNRLVRALRRVEDRLAGALAASKRYEASPRRAEVEALARKALEDGVEESERVWKLYEGLADESL